MALFQAVLVSLASGSALLLALGLGVCSLIGAHREGKRKRDPFELPNR